MEKEKLISLLDKYRDIPEEILNIIFKGEIIGCYETSNQRYTIKARINITEGKDKKYYDTKRKVIF